MDGVSWAIFIGRHHFTYTICGYLCAHIRTHSWLTFRFCADSICSAQNRWHRWSITHWNRCMYTNENHIFSWQIWSARKRLMVAHIFGLFDKYWQSCSVLYWFFFSQFSYLEFMLVEWTDVCILIKRESKESLVMCCQTKWKRTNFAGMIEVNDPMTLYLICSFRLDIFVVQMHI